MLLAEKVCLITGGGSGIGEATAKLFASEGAFVIITDVDEKAANRVVSEIRPKAKFINCDVTQEKQVHDTIKKIVHK